MLNNMTCDCLPYTIYNTFTGKCDGDCGDGVAFDNDCDLGTTNNGYTNTGCDANCHVVPGWYCYSTSKYSGSTCVRTQNYTG